MNAFTRSLCTLAALALPLFATPAFASDTVAEPVASTAKPASIHLDAEVDPTAYIARGWSVHVGLGYGNVRLDLGTFAMNVPKFAAGNDDFDVSFDGVGGKLQYFFVDPTHGAFVGVDGGASRMKAQLSGSDAWQRQTIYNLGVDAGYRFDIVAGFYATTWIGLGRSFGVKEMNVGGETYSPSAWTIFPAVHLGYRFL